jgi:hypothetical protein
MLASQSPRRFLARSRAARETASVSSRPPGPGRLRAARAAGLRPRSNWLPLALLALALALLVPETLDDPAAWFADQLARAFDPAGIDGLALPRFGPGFALVIGALVAVALVRAGPRQGGSLVPAIDARRARIPIATRIALTGLGTILALWLLAPVVAAAARSVDASPASLVSFWLVWLRRTLLVLAGAAGLLAALEWLASAKQLWLALHLTPEQVRELRQNRPR